MMAAKRAKLSFTAPNAGRRALKARKAHTFGADLNQYNEMDLENLAKTARLVLCDVGLHQAGSTSWDYKGMTPADAQKQMEAVLTMVAAEEKRRAGERQAQLSSSEERRNRLNHQLNRDANPEGHIGIEETERLDVRLGTDADDEDILRGSR